MTKYARRCIAHTTWAGATFFAAFVNRKSPKTRRRLIVGFHPAFDSLASDASLPDWTIVTVGTSYMDGQPVKVPKNPVWDGDIPDYIPGVKLELREPAPTPEYQIKAVRVGAILIADRVLLANISWNDLREHGFC